MYVKKQIASYNIKYDTIETYNGDNFVSINVFINYVNKSYNIKLPELNIIGDDKLPLYIAKCLEKVYNFVMIELYHNEDEHVYYTYNDIRIKLYDKIKVGGFIGEVIFKDKEYYVDFNIQCVLLKNINKTTITKL